MHLRNFGDYFDKDPIANILTFVLGSFVIILIIPLILLGRIEKFFGKDPLVKKRKEF